MNFPISNQHLFRAALLVLVLLLAQFALILHKAELVNHSSTAVCEYCLTHANLTDGSTFVSLPPLIVPTSSDEPVFFPAAFAAPRHPSYSARAPPLS
jgi:hypothetical protein